jgi:hypothetical protein
MGEDGSAAVDRMRMRTYSAMLHRLLLPRISDCSAVRRLTYHMFTVDLIAPHLSDPSYDAMRGERARLFFANRDRLGIS